MENELKELMKEIDLTIKDIESQLIQRMTNLDYIKSKCKEILGYEDNIMWNVSFNASVLKDVPKIFTNDNSSALSTFSNRIESEFNQISRDSGIEKDILYSMYNFYLLNNK